MQQALIRSGLVPLYKEPSRHSGLTDEAFFGMNVTVVSQIGEWARIITPYRYEGYVEASCLVFDDDSVSRYLSLTRYICARSWADIKKEPEVEAETLATVPRGSPIALKALPGTEQWLPVYLPDGREGYIPGNYVQAPPIPWREQKEENFREGVVQSALLYLGTQYRWGGKTSVGIDCSGLASVAYMLNGALIYRDAKIMPGFDIHEIPRENLKKGDLLFYKGHVTLYVGDKRFIHSTAHYGTEGVCLCGMEPGMDGYREDLEKIYLASGSLF